MSVSCHRTTIQRQSAAYSASGADHDGWLHLLVVEGDSSRIFRLPTNGEVVVGRDDTADLRLADQTVSRMHAKVVVRDGEAELVDLGSRNATLVNGEVIIGPRLLSSNDMITICGATLVFHSSVSAEAHRTILDARQFWRRLEEELQRSLLYERSLTVLVVLLNRSASNRSEVLSAIAQTLRAMDPMAGCSPDEILILLPEVDALEARHEVRRILDAVKSYAPKVCVGTASCPVDGTDAGSLVSRARAAAIGADGQPHSSERRCQTLRAGEREILVADAVMKQVYALVERLAVSDLPVLIHGETGAGKDLVASALHHWSRRQSAKFLTINCAAIQENLVESELFGHEKGAFSGAVAAKPGLFEVADGGTVFLDEVGELSPTAQAKLLRVLETKRVTRLGGVHERSTDIRVVAATNRDLRTEVAEQRFRRDLYFRLGGATVRLPPLRERRAEIPLLANVFLGSASARAQRHPLVLSSGAIDLLTAHPWPGNVRELQNLMELVVATEPNGVLHAEALAHHLAGVEALSCYPSPASRSPSSLMRVALAPQRFRPLRDEIEELTRHRIQQALAATGGNQTKAAELLSMPLRTFVSKVKHLR